MQCTEHHSGQALRVKRCIGGSFAVLGLAVVVGMNVGQAAMAQVAEREGTAALLVRDDRDIGGVLPIEPLPDDLAGSEVAETNPSMAEQLGLGDVLDNAKDQVDQLGERLNEIDALDDRVEALDERLQVTSTRQGASLAGMEGLEARLTALESSVHEFAQVTQSRIDALAERLALEADAPEGDADAKPAPEAGEASEPPTKATSASDERPVASGAGTKQAVPEADTAQAAGSSTDDKGDA